MNRAWWIFKSHVQLQLYRICRSQFLERRYSPCEPRTFAARAASEIKNEARSSIRNLRWEASHYRKLLLILSDGAAHCDNSILNYVWQASASINIFPRTLLLRRASHLYRLCVQSFAIFCRISREKSSRLRMHRRLMKNRFSDAPLFTARSMTLLAE